MILSSRVVAGLLLCAAVPSGCSKPPEAVTSRVGEPAPFTPSPPAAAVPPPAAPASDPATFVPLQSQAVKDAIHRALATGRTQRWSEGALGGYAVPSTTTGANGCRAVRYTVDQQPAGSYASITACDASR